MGQPDWSKIKFENYPDWKKKQMGYEAEKIIAALEKTEFKCEVCGKVCKNKVGLVAHLRSHK